VYVRPPVIGPVPPTLVQRYWPAPTTPPTLGVLVAAAATGLLLAATLFTDRLGLQSGLVASALTAVAVLATRRGRDAGDARRPRVSSRTAFTVLAVALGWVPAVRDGTPTVVLSVLGATGLAVLAAVDGRTWPAVLLAWPASAVACVRSALWAGTRLRTLRRPAGLAGWVRGVSVAVVSVWVFAALLSRADAAFAAVLDALLPSIDLSSLPERLVVLVIGAVAALTLAFSAVAPPRWEAVRVPYRAGPAVEWALPLGLVDVLLALFVCVQAAALFGGLPQGISDGVTPAERARQGFGQLVAVTLLAVVLLAWAGRRAGTDRSRHRRLLGVLGGGLVGLVLVVVASALRRMALYEQAFGWTVLRIHVAAFEVWLAVVLILCAGAWALRRTEFVARGVVLAAGAGLLVLNLAGPDALAAAANVDRFARTGKVDTGYLSRLSDDAVPALDRLPEPQRRRVLGDRSAQTDPWFAASVSRLRAAAILEMIVRPASQSDAAGHRLRTGRRDPDVAQQPRDGLRRRPAVGVPAVQPVLAVEPAGAGEVGAERRDRLLGRRPGRDLERPVAQPLEELLAQRPGQT